MSFDPVLLAGESKTVEFKTRFDNTMVESRQAIQHFSQRSMRSICPVVVKVVNYYPW